MIGERRSILPRTRGNVKRRLRYNPHLYGVREARMLVGINRYPMAGADLRGCVTDVKDLSAALIDFHGFKKREQTSADAFINGRYDGALTFALVDAIRKSKGRLTYRELHDRASVVLKKRKFDQVPQLEGRIARFNLPLFSV